MAFDPPYYTVAQEFIGQNPSYTFQPMKGLTERELKLALPNPSGVVALPSNNHEFLITQGALKIKALLSNLERDGMWIDPQGDIPNNYVLASLNLDTVEETLPTARFFRAGWQCRIRKPLWVHGDGAEFNYNAMLRQIDANMKTRLSGLGIEEHRIELEEVIRQHPSAFFKEFKRVVTLPNFTKDIDDRHLRVSDICLTSRTGFYTVIKDPESNSHVLLHGTYDASNFVTANVFTRKDLRLEIELEAKGILTQSNTIMNEKEQDAIVNRAFAIILQEARTLGLTPFTLSKLEESMDSAHKHYKQNNGHLPDFARHLTARGIKHSTPDSPALHHLYAIAAGSRVAEIVRTLKEDGINSTLAILAQSMPDPRTMLDLSDVGQRRLAVA